MLICDLNCDIGEGLSNDAAIIPYITSANIACGFHAGSEAIMIETVQRCIEHHVAIGAHPSFPDREHFGRTEMHLHDDELSEMLSIQILKLQQIAASYHMTLQHVKPHGALYNMAAREKKLAMLIAEAVRSIDEDLMVYALSGSELIAAAKQAGLKTRSEVFADRTYMHDGTLTPRTNAHALITDTEVAVKQVLQMVHEGTVTTIDGSTIPVVAETICVHGDGKNVVHLVQAIHTALKKTKGKA